MKPIFTPKEKAEIVKQHFLTLTRVFDKGRFLYLRKPNKYVRLYDLPGIERWVC